MKAAAIGDVVGVTLYRKVWMSLGADHGFYITSPLPPVHYYRKAFLIDLLFHKPVIGIELQAEPWTPQPFYHLPLTEQKKTMDLAQFQKNVQYAEDTGFDQFYFWGAEWWYWLKTKHQNPEIWNEAKKLFVN